jgi:hypothetical protein
MSILVVPVNRGSNSFRCTINYNYFTNKFKFPSRWGTSKINIFKYNMLLHRVCWACRVAWSILLALGARDSDSNSDRPIPPLFFLRLYLDIFINVRKTFRKLNVMSNIAGCVDHKSRAIRRTTPMHTPRDATTDGQPFN